MALQWAGSPPQSSDPFGSGQQGMAVVIPEAYYPAQFPSYSDWIFRDPRISAQSIEDPRQYLNQMYQVHDYAVEGKVQPIGQNINVLTAQGWINPSTLVPEYGLYMDTPQDVYANIARGGFI